MDCDPSGERSGGLDGLGFEGAVFVAIAGLFLLFDGHVFILDGVEDLSTVLAFDEFSIFLTGDDFDDGVFARRGHDGCVGWLLWIFPPVRASVNRCFSLI